MPFALCVAFVAAASAVKTSVRGAQPKESSVHSVNAYEAFRRQFSVERGHEDHSVYHSRVALFERRREEVEKHNAQPQLGWVKAVNKFADYTDAEFHAMLGHRLSQRGRAAGMPAPAMAAASLMQLRPEHELAMTVDWRQKLNVSMTAKDQGGCGSCWAVAAAGAMETRSEMAGQAAPEVSYEQLVDCVENTKECGGTGGCQGATSELAFDYIAKHGVGLKKDYKGYQSHGDGSCRPPSHAALTATSFVRVQENEAKPLREAVSMGTVVVSADAGGWSSYGGGVFAGCDKDAVINHAILLVGYGTDAKSNKDYWLIRNSWGPDWGEAGFIRILRHKDDESYCGVDHKPLDGVGCKGGPATLPVCGMCGILADSAYPTEVALA